MNIEIEVTEAEIKDAIERKVRQAIADQTTGYAFDSHLKDTIKAAWKPAVQAIIEECIADSERIRADVVKAIEAKIKAQVNALMKGK